MNFLMSFHQFTILCVSPLRLAFGLAKLCLPFLFLAACSLSPVRPLVEKQRQGIVQSQFDYKKIAQIKKSCPRNVKIGQPIFFKWDPELNIKKQRDNKLPLPFSLNEREWVQPSGSLAQEVRVKFSVDNPDLSGDFECPVQVDEFKELKFGQASTRLDSDGEVETYQVLKEDGLLFLSVFSKTELERDFIIQDFKKDTHLSLLAEAYRLLQTNTETKSLNGADFFENTKVSFVPDYFISQDRNSVFAFLKIMNRKEGSKVHFALVEIFLHADKQKNNQVLWLTENALMDFDFHAESGEIWIKTYAENKKNNQDFAFDLHVLQITNKKIRLHLQGVAWAHFLAKKNKFFIVQYDPEYLNQKRLLWCDQRKNYACERSSLSQEDSLLLQSLSFLASPKSDFIVFGLKQNENLGLGIVDTKRSKQHFRFITGFDYDKSMRTEKFNLSDHVQFSSSGDAFVFINKGGNLEQLISVKIKDQVAVVRSIDQANFRFLRFKAINQDFLTYLKQESESELRLYLYHFANQSLRPVRTFRQGEAVHTLDFVTLSDNKLPGENEHRLIFSIYDANLKQNKLHSILTNGMGEKVLSGNLNFSLNSSLVFASHGMSLFFVASSQGIGNEGLYSVVLNGQDLVKIDSFITWNRPFMAKIKSLAVTRDNIFFLSNANVSKEYELKILE